MSVPKYYFFMEITNRLNKWVCQCPRHIRHFARHWATSVFMTMCPLYHKFTLMYVLRAVFIKLCWLLNNLNKSTDPFFSVFYSWPSLLPSLLYHSFLLFPSFPNLSFFLPLLPSYFPLLLSPPLSSPSFPNLPPPSPLLPLSFPLPSVTTR